jgi:hypothetical protein
MSGSAICFLLLLNNKGFLLRKYYFLVLISGLRSHSIRLVDKVIKQRITAVIDVISLTSGGACQLFGKETV